MELPRIHVVSALFDIYEVRPRAGLRDRLSGRYKSVRNRDDSIARLHSGGDQGKPQGVCSVPYADAMLGSAKLCKLSFEALHHRAADESSGLQQGSEDCEQVLFQF